MTSNIDSSKMEKVSSIASRFQGQSRVQPEQVFQLVSYGAVAAARRSADAGTFGRTPGGTFSNDTNLNG